MVKIRELDENQVNIESGSESDNASLYSTTSGSDIEDDDDSPLEESLWERISALVDIIPPSRRRAITERCTKVYDTLFSVGTFLGKGAWVLCTTAMVVGLPLALELKKDWHFGSE